MATAALGRLRAEDERMAGDAEAALGSLTWDRGPQAITQHGVQAFLWHELPRKWLTDREASCTRRFAGAVAGAGRAAPLRGDLPWAPDRRGAAGYEGGGREGFREFRRAQERSGVELPDLPGRGWGSPGGLVMGKREAGAFVSVASALELAVRAECLDWLLILGRGRLEQVLRVYVWHYITTLIVRIGRSACSCRIRPLGRRSLAWIGRTESSDAISSVVSCTSTDKLHERIGAPYALPGLLADAAAMRQSHRHGHGLSPLSPSPSSFSPMTRHSPDRMTALWWPIQSLRPPSSSTDRFPIAK